MIAQAVSGASCDIRVNANEDWEAARQAAVQAGQDPDEIEWTDWKYMALADYVMNWTRIGPLVSDSFSNMNQEEVISCKYSSWMPI